MEDNQTVFGRIREQTEEAMHNRGWTLVSIESFDVIGEITFVDVIYRDRGTAKMGVVIL